MTAGNAAGDTNDSKYLKQSERTDEDRTNSPQNPNKQVDVSCMPHLPPKFHDDFLNVESRPSNIFNSTDLLKGSIPLRLLPPIGHKVVQPLIGQPGPRGNANRDLRLGERGLPFQSRSSAELSYDVEDLKILWSDLVIKERIGAGLLFYCHIIKKIAIAFSFEFLLNDLDRLHMQVLLVQFIVLNGMVQ